MTVSLLQVLIRQKKDVKTKDRNSKKGKKSSKKK